jgi:multidrug efflux pump subunit AcrA (membrane-fusion protein)
MKLALSRRAWRRTLWTAAGVIVVAGVVTAVVVANDGTPPPAAATTVTVRRGAVTLAVAAAGTIESSQTIGLSFPVAGTVTVLNVKAGDLVTAGQELAAIDPTDVQSNLNSAQQRVADAQNALDRATASANLPICPTAAPTTAAPTPSGSASPHPTASPSPHPSASRTTSATTPQNCQPAGKTSVTDTVLQAQQQYNNAELAVIRAQTQLTGTVLKAPIAGRVLSVGGKVGSTAGGGSAFIELGDITNLTVRAEFSEADVGRLAVGQVASIALPHVDKPVSGKVSQIDPAATVSNRLVRYGVTITFDQVPADLLLGQSATVTVTTASVDNVLYVTSAAVTGVEAGDATVNVRTPAGDESRAVTIGLRGDQYTEVTSGLVEGDIVVLPH